MTLMTLRRSPVMAIDSFLLLTTTDLDIGWLTRWKPAENN